MHQQHLPQRSLPHIVISYNQIELTHVVQLKTFELLEVCEFEGRNMLNLVHKGIIPVLG